VGWWSSSFLPVSGPPSPVEAAIQMISQSMCRSKAVSCVQVVGSAQLSIARSALEALHATLKNHGSTTAGAALTRANGDACSSCAQQLALQYSNGLQASSPVCGADGFTYLHRCLAECQGVQVAGEGACEGMPAMLGGDANSQAAAATAGKLGLHHHQAAGCPHPSSSRACCRWLC
jgi:hypothetical protein